MEPYSVLMCVYAKENPEHLRAAVSCMLNQTVPPEQFVLVCDGPLTRELDRVAAEFESAYPGVFEVLRLPENRGVGAASDAGLAVCRNDLVAKMDSDDWSVPDRCRLQLEKFEEDPRLSVVGGQLEEFVGDPEHPVAVRRVPLTHEEILKFARRRMPFNNPTVMFRKSAVTAVGGYGPLRRCEDYDLFYRMLAAGCRAANLDRVLVKYRLDKAAYGRRGTLRHFRDYFGLKLRMYRSGFASFSDFLIPVLAQGAVCLVPAGIKNKIYMKFLRRR